MQPISQTNPPKAARPWAVSIYLLGIEFCYNLVMVKEFKQFLLRGNVVDLAVGVVMGVAFGAVVNALVTDLLTPLLSALVLIPDLGGLTFSVNGSEFLYGHFVNALISFLLVASAVFFFIIKPMNMLVKKPPADPTTKKCGECLSEIPLAAKRCSHCAQVVL